MSLEKFPEPSFLFKPSASRAECDARHRPKAKQLDLLGPPGHPPHLHPTCCSDSGPGCLLRVGCEASRPVTACPLAQVLYSPWELSLHRPEGMLLPFPSHIWVSGTRVPSFGWFSAWVPARVFCTDQRRRGLALAQVARTGPGHIWRVSSAVCPSQLAPMLTAGMGWAKGHCFCR